MENSSTKKPDDYVVATGRQYSVKFFVERCCKFLGIKKLNGSEGLNERAVIVEVDNKNKLKIKKNNIIVRE